SGDLHGSNLIKALTTMEPGLKCRVWGGDLMQAAGGELVRHYRDLAFMGFWEVLKNLRTILRNLRFCQKDILAHKPDALVLIDYPGFNLRIAKWAKKQGIPVIYYISPQIWAWHSSRVHRIKRDVDKMLVILPFEKAFYEKYGVAAEFVGHPLLDVIPAGSPLQQADHPATVTLLPGSRKQEVKRILPVMLSVTSDFPEIQFTVAAASALPDPFFQPFLERYPNVTLERGKTYDLLARSHAALVKSGTSTLETALIGTPQVVCYAGSPISFAIAKRIVNVKYISLVNLILDRPLLLELIQDDLNRTNLKAALNGILNPEKAGELRKGYAELRHLLGDGGASGRAASIIIAFFKQ
ncbi:MAG: lipid-A-disaccharide synthase, partial [Thermoanaerobaculia bacterium]|nr:lipid-A-disaccharide synthase [Thermoanaerobaculia bacterium]